MLFINYTDESFGQLKEDFRAVAYNNKGKVTRSSFRVLKM